MPRLDRAQSHRFPGSLKQIRKHLLITFPIIFHLISDERFQRRLSPSLYITYLDLLCFDPIDRSRTLLLRHTIDRLVDCSLPVFDTLWLEMKLHNEHQRVVGRNFTPFIHGRLST